MRHAASPCLRPEHDLGEEHAPFVAQTVEHRGQLFKGQLVADHEFPVQRTAGELGALLLEARLIKEQQPLFNKRLRRNKQLCAWLLADDRPQIVYAREVDFSHQQHL